MFDPYRKWLGIPEQFRPPTHYQMLGISADEQDREVIEAAVIRQSAYVRNFQNGPNAEHATRLLNEIAAARGCLLDAKKRAAYDATIRPAMATVVQVPQGTLPYGTAIPVAQLGAQATVPTATAASTGPAVSVSPKTGRSPANGSGLQPIVVRPVSWVDTLTPEGSEVTSSASGNRPVAATPGTRTERRNPNP